MNSTEYFNLVQRTVMDEWKQQLPFQVTAEDLEALQANSLKEITLYYQHLVKLIPNIFKNDLQVIFEKPFIKLDHKKLVYNMKSLVDLGSGSIEKLFVYDSLLIGILDAKSLGLYISSDKNDMPQYLVAYDMEKQEIVWDFPLKLTSNHDRFRGYSYKDITIKQAGNKISIQYTGEKVVSLIEPNTGVVSSTLIMPFDLSKSYDQFYTNSSGIAYQMLNIPGDGRGRVLFGGKFIDGTWVSIFETKTPSGIFTPLSTHIGFFDPAVQISEDTYKTRLVIYGPTGDLATIYGCGYRCAVKDEKLFLIAEDIKDSNKCYLTVRSLTFDKRVVSEEEKSITLNEGNPSIEKVYDNGHIILKGLSSRIFVDLNTEKVIYKESKSSSSYTENVVTMPGELLKWEEWSLKREYNEVFDAMNNANDEDEKTSMISKIITSIKGLKTSNNNKSKLEVVHSQ